MGVHALRSPAGAPPQDPARATLADAIAAYETAHATAESARSAVLRARDSLSAANRRVVDAGHAIATARQTQADNLVEAARNGGAAPVRSPLRAARQAETEANDEVEAARSALAVVEEECANAEYSERMTHRRLQKAAHEVLVTAAPELMQSIGAKWNDLLKDWYAIQFLAGCLEPGDPRKRQMDGVLQRYRREDLAELDAATGKRPWGDALAALMSDANAALP